MKNTGFLLAQLCVADVQNVADVHSSVHPQQYISKSVWYGMSIYWCLQFPQRVNRRFELVLFEHVLFLCKLKKLIISVADVHFRRCCMQITPLIKKYVSEKHYSYLLICIYSGYSNDIGMNVSVYFVFQLQEGQKKMGFLTHFC